MWAEVCGARMAATWLAAPAPAERLVDVVRDMCGVHAQVPAAAEVSLGIRVAGITRVDVRAALADGRLVRTYGPRGTVHVLPGDELGLWLAALAAAPRRENPVDPRYGLLPAQLDAVLGAIAEVLDEHEAAGRDGPTWPELGTEVVRRTGPWAADEVYPAFGERWPRWRPAIGVAAARGLLVFGPNRGNRVTYRRADPALVLPGGEWALGQVALRYLRSYGPATPAHFAQWLGMLPGAATALFRTLDLERVADGYRPAGWSPPPGARPLRLLPHFDAYLIACHPRPAVFPGRAATRALSGGAAGPVPALLVDGTVAGVWHQRRSGRRLALTVEPFAPLDAGGLAAVHAQADRIGEIVEATPTVTIGEVTARAHL